MKRGRMISFAAMCIMFLLYECPSFAFRLNRSILNDMANGISRETQRRPVSENRMTQDLPPSQEQQNRQSDSQRNFDSDRPVRPSKTNYPRTDRRTKPDRPPQKAHVDKPVVGTNDFHKPQPRRQDRYDPHIIPPVIRHERNPELENWNLSGRRPSVTLRNSRGQRSSLFFRDDGDRFVIEDYEQLIPRRTRFRVPRGYVAYCNEEDTMILDGIGYRVDYDGYTKICYYEGAEVEYTKNSGLVIMPKEYAEKPLKTIAPTDYYKEEIYITPLERLPDYERKSTDPEKVIVTYDLPREDEEALIRIHKEALKLISKPGRIETYTRIFEAFDGDYLAAYYAGLAEFDSNDGQRSKDWCEKALAINPNYYPAKSLKRRAEGLIKGM